MTSPARHGHARKHRTSRTYWCWANMIQRCTNPKKARYPRYGGRGIRICERWQTFDGFLADMGVRPDGMTLERLDRDGDYEPGNCIWASITEQANNRSNNRLIEFKGKTQTVAAWSREVGLPHVTVRMRLWRGWSIERALTEPV